jgi:uncharacterized protein Yka (UPF0111/DUF47 family)
MQVLDTDNNIIETIDDVLETAQKFKDLIDSFNGNNQNDFKPGFLKFVRAIQIVIQYLYGITQKTEPSILPSRKLEELNEPIPNRNRFFGK